MYIFYLTGQTHIYIDVKSTNEW